MCGQEHCKKEYKVTFGRSAAAQIGNLPTEPAQFSGLASLGQAHFIMHHRKVMPCDGGINNRGIILTQLQALYILWAHHFSLQIGKLLIMAGLSVAQISWDLMYT